MRGIVDKFIPPHTQTRKRAQAIKKSFFRPYRMLTSPMRLMPDFIIIGAARSGTTTFYSNLTQHPYIVPAMGKEVHFFDYNDNFNKGVLWYRAHFPFLAYKRYVKQIYDQNVVTGEASPYYIFHPHVPKRVFEMLPQVKLIAMLRNPVDRAYSQYNRVVRHGNETVSFEDAIQKEQEGLQNEAKKMLENEDYSSIFHQRYSYLSRGIYVDQLKAWMELFPRKQFLILKSEDYFKDASATLKQVAAFLGVPTWEPQKAKRSKSPGYAKMNPATRERLLEYFKPHNQRLYEFLEMDFGWDK